jgi:hypothetical protein
MADGTITDRTVIMKASDKVSKKRALCSKM